MKKFVLLLFLIFINFFYAQNIGIVGNVNPKLGYSHTKAAIKFTPIFEKDLDYDLNDFINTTFSQANKTTVHFNDFDWKTLGFFDEFTKSVPILDYLKNYCESKKVDQLFIIRKVNSFKLIGPMDMFFNFKNNFGIMTFPNSQKRAFMYYNFAVYKYSLKDNKIYSPLLKKNERMDVYLNKSFENAIYDDNKMLKDNRVTDYFIPIFENFMKNSFLKLLNQNEKEVYIFKK